MITMITEDKNKASLKLYCTHNLQSTEISDLIQLLLKNQQETNENVHSLQKATAGLREQLEDFRAEQTEDNAEFRRMLTEVKRNKVWIPRERF